MEQSKDQQENTAIAVYSDPNLVVRSKYIVAASYKLTVQEQRLIYMLTAKINKTDADFKPYRFTNKEITSLMKGRKNSFAEITKYARQLRKRELKIITDQSVLFTGWLSSVEPFTDKKEIELCFDGKLKPYLLELKEKIVQTKLDQLLRFDSIYSGRFYEICVGIIGLKYGKLFDIEDIRELFELEPEKYALAGSIKARIVAPAIKEINEVSDIYVALEERKEKKRLIGWKMTARYKTDIELDEMNIALGEVKAAVDQLPPPAPAPEDSEPDAEDLKKKALIAAVIELYEGSMRFIGYISEMKAIQILEAAKWDLDIVKESFTWLEAEKKVDKPVGLHITCIKGEFYKEKKAKPAAAIDNFNNFEQRTYDFDSLEKKLLGWDNTEEAAAEDQKNEVDQWILEDELKEAENQIAAASEALSDQDKKIIDRINKDPENAEQWLEICEPDQLERIKKFLDCKKKELLK